jgi:hypothetical protein
VNPNPLKGHFSSAVDFEFMKMSTNEGASSTNKDQILAQQAKKASLILGALSLTQRNTALEQIHAVLQAQKHAILEANQLDMQVQPPSFQFNAAGGLGTRSSWTITIVHG